MTMSSIPKPKNCNNWIWIEFVISNAKNNNSYNNNNSNNNNVDVVDAGAFANTVVFPIVGFVFWPNVFSVDVFMCFIDTSVTVISGVIFVSCGTIVLSLFSVQIFSNVLRWKNPTLKDFTQLKHILCSLKRVILNYGRVNSICMLSCVCLPDCLLRYEWTHLLYK